MLDTGRIRIEIRAHREALRDVWTDTGPVGRHDVWASYEWIPGETAAAFVERVAIEVDGLREAIFRFSADAAGSEDEDNDVEASPSFA
jgi:hypothetical protein